MIEARLKQERERLGLTQPDFAKVAGAAKRTLIDWEKGVSSPTAVQLSALSGVGVDVNYVLTGIPFLASELKQKLISEGRLSEFPALQATIGDFHIADGERVHAQQRHQDYIYVPRYDVQASAGNGSVVSDESVVDHLAFKRDWITRNLGLDPQRLALIDVAGDSMSPTIGDGDLILIDTRPTPVKSEGVYVINLSGALLVKRLRMRLSGVVDVVSDNARYGTETISGEQLAQLAVLGRVVWQGRRV